jgi:sialate O-acetylesterase
VNRRLVLSTALLLAVAAPAAADVRLPGVFGDHMVLQRDRPVRVWGWADAGEKVTVKIAGRTATTETGADGRWQVELSPLKAGGPHRLTVRGKNTIRVEDVLVGEVWLCSGQSNMAWTVDRSANATAEIADADDGKIRQFQAPRVPAGTPYDDISSSWEVCSPRTAGRFTACGYYMARELRKRLRVPVGLISTTWGGTRIEPWIAPEGLAAVPSLSGIAEQAAAAAGSEPANHQQPTVLYNGMVHALVGYGIRGAIWYQGESNHREGAAYVDKKRALIGGWRELWGIGDFPFYFVQIAPFRYGKEDPGVLPAFWEAQAAVLDAVPNTGMVVTNDIATLDDIHPPNKQDVGLRLALLALNRTYGKSCVDSGPVFREMTVEDGAIRVAFDHADRLRSRDRKPLTHFEIAGASGAFVAAGAKIDGDSVVLTATEVPQPLVMRFAWHKLAQPNLVNGAGLPAGAFRAGELPKPDFLGEIDEAERYTLVYDLDLARLSASPEYAVDASGDVGAFDRIAYLVELQGTDGTAQYVWVSMVAFTDDSTKIGIPTVASGARFQKVVENVRVRTNAEGLSTWDKLAGNVEMWPSNYGPGNAAAIPLASAEIWDFGDAPAAEPDGYGSMQVHLPESGRTLFAINNWKAGSGADIGIGSSSLDPRTTDWTFARNAGGYPHKRLRVFVRLR